MCNSRVYPIQRYRPKTPMETGEEIKKGQVVVYKLEEAKLFAANPLDLRNTIVGIALRDLAKGEVVFIPWLPLPTEPDLV